MAKKSRRRASATQTTEILSRLQGNIRALQGDAEKILKRTQKQATQLITRDQRKAVERLVKQAQKLRSDLEKRAKRATRDVESRASRIRNTIEKETNKRLGPLLERFDLPTRQEVRGLARRITELERQIKGRDEAATGPTSSTDSD